MTYTNLNRVLNTVALEQGIKIGSWEWLQGGPAAWSGQSGEHASFGWKHDHKINPDYIRAVIANYGSRGTHYLDALYRQFGYAAGGRPRGWKPELPGDNPDGSKAYLTREGIVIVSGPEAEHFWIDPLWAVMDAPAITVTALGEDFPSNDLAEIMAIIQVRSIIGQIRDKGLDPYPWPYGDRANSRILDTWLQALKRGIIEKDDADTGLRFIEKVLLPFSESAPSVSRFGTAPEGMFPVGTFNGLYWLLPVFYDAMKILAGYEPAKGLAARFEAIVRRWSQWALDLEKAVPGRGFDMSRFYVNAKAFHAAGKPLDTIAPLLKVENILFDDEPGEELTWEVWSFRACSVAAKVTGAAELAKAEQGIIKRHGGNPDNRNWMVDADRNYATL